MTRLLLRNCHLVVTMDDDGREISGADIAIEDGWITEIGTTRIEGTFDDVIHGEELIAIPGLINTHHHLYQSLTRGFPESDGMELFPWLQCLYPIWAGLDEEMIYVSTRTGLAELALSGCTTCADHLYVFPTGSDGFVDAQVAAATSLGVRFHPTRGSMDLGQTAGGLPPDSVVQTVDAILADTERAITRHHDPAPGSMVQLGVAPCSPFSVSPELMRSSAELARKHGVRLHTHIAETRDEERFSRDHFGCTPVQFLESMSWVASDVWVAHCVHPNGDDLRLLAENNACVAHCPTSNMLLGSGMAPVPAFLAHGITVGLGVDGSASNDANDLRAEVKQALLSARVRDGAGSLSTRAALRLATRGSAACLGRSDIGSLEVGKVADMALFDRNALALAGTQPDPVAGIVLGSLHPETVLVHGSTIVRGGRLVRAEERLLATEHNRQTRRLLDRTGR